MEDKTSALKTLVVPAVISLLIFLVLSYILVPVWRRYRARYSQYLPLDAISSHTTSLRHRLTARIAAIALPSSWRADRDLLSRASTDLDNDELYHGEELNDVDQHMRRAIESHARASRPDNTRRLSRDLEEGFRDDSDDEHDR